MGINLTEKGDKLLQKKVWKRSVRITEVSTNE